MFIPFTKAAKCIRNEEQVLEEGLEGYSEYRNRVQLWTVEVLFIRIENQ